MSATTQKILIANVKYKILYNRKKQSKGKSIYIHHMPANNKSAEFYGGTQISISQKKSLLQVFLKGILLIRKHFIQSYFKLLGKQ